MRRFRDVMGYHDSAARIARGAAAGAFAAAFPLPGLQIPLSLLAAWLARGNKAVSLIPQFISNAVTMIPLAYLQYEVGALLWPLKAAGAKEAMTALRAVVAEWQWLELRESIKGLLPVLCGLGDAAGPLLLGVILTGAVAAVVAYPVTVIAVWTWRARLHGGRSRRARVRPRKAGPELGQAPAVPLSRAEIVSRYIRWPAHIQRASSARLLVDGGQGFGEMLAAIDSATQSVDLETYILYADHIGTRFQQALLRAARRGIRVRLLYDYIGSLGLSNRFVQELADAGVDVSVYRPPLFPHPFRGMQRRDHRKILLVDRHIFFTGGLNISDDNAPVEEGGKGWRDTHVRLEGPEVAAAGLHLFNRGWRKATPHSIVQRGNLKRRLRSRLDKIVALRREGPPVPQAGLVGEGLPVQVIGNDEQRFRHRIQQAYLHAIRAARRYILIENAYFIPSRAIRAELARAARRGVYVAVAVARYSDITLAAYASRGLYSGLLERGIHIFEWPHGMLHAKTAVIDDCWAIVGSYNFDHRSLFHQLEDVAVVADPDFAITLRKQTFMDLACCHQVTLWEHESRSWLQLILESSAGLVRHWL
jgi:cardiolipin synthase